MKRKFLNNSFLKQLFLLLITSVLSSSFTFFLMKKQMNFDVNKELYFKQMHVYNRISDLYRNFGIYRTTLIAPTQKRTILIFKDQFENVVKEEEVLNSSVKIDTLDIEVPNFVVQDKAYDNFFEDIKYISDNKNNLSPGIYKKVNDILNFLDKHPVPEKKDRMSFILYWGNKSVYGEFYSKLRELYYTCKDEQERLFAN